MSPLRAISAAAFLAVMPALAQADGFYTRDLGEGGSPEQCLTRARQALEAYIRQSNSGRAIVANGAWSVDGYDIAPGDVDVQMACPYRDSYVSVMLLVAHSAGPESDRLAVVDGIAAQWNTPSQPPTTPSGK